jgi:hypothetical protein
MQVLSKYLRISRKLRRSRPLNLSKGKCRKNCHGKSREKHRRLASEQTSLVERPFFNSWIIRERTDDRNPPGRFRKVSWAVGYCGGARRLQQKRLRILSSGG